MLKTGAPIVIDLGGASRKGIRQLKDGSGKLSREVLDVVSDIHERLGTEAQNKELIPIVVVYSRKKRRPRSVIDLVL